MNGKEIRTLRESLRLSQQEFANRIRTIDPLLKTDRNGISRWERGVRHPTTHALAALEEVARDASQE